VGTCIEPWDACRLCSCVWISGWRVSQASSDRLR
jgi:hypothetical protein